MVSPEIESPVTDATAKRGEVAEFQGLYGAYHVSEVLLQKIWLRGAFDRSRARTIAGEAIEIVHPGAWNRLSGPDFRGAQLRIGGREVHGDVEVHFRTEAWKQHGHDADPAYDKVVLHVVLFPPTAERAATITRAGREVPVLALVDLLWHDLEEYAVDDAVSALSGRDALPLVERLLSSPSAERAAAVEEAAERRWREKQHYARLRIDRCGWEEACHLTALEILGYRANREAMLRVGARYPWSSWSGSTGVGSPSSDDLLAAGEEAWSVRGVRPANQPRVRLEQYRRWMAAVPDWPVRLRNFGLPDISEKDKPGERTISAARRHLRLAALRERLAGDLTGEALGGLRLDTFAINLVLPFLAVEGRSGSAGAWWRLWPPGDVAEVLLQAARQLRTPEEREVRSNGFIQGLLGLHLERARLTGFSS